ncbi:MAG: cyclic pyranopterin monophosphate synthase MoaC [Acidobacteriota bacterium]
MTRGARLTHTGPEGKARMVDVSAKAVTVRRATAEARVVLPPAAFQALAANRLAKGDALGTARLAGIMAAKRTGELIPLCHPLGVEHVDVTIELEPDRRAVRIVALARIAARTGVEMEAMTAAAVAALTIYDMCKSVDKGIVIENVRLLSKSGGKSGSWSAR